MKQTYQQTLRQISKSLKGNLRFTQTIKISIILDTHLINRHGWMWWVIIYSLEIAVCFIIYLFTKVLICLWPHLRQVRCQKQKSNQWAFRLFLHSLIMHTQSQRDQYSFNFMGEKIKKLKTVLSGQILIFSCSSTHKGF